MQTLAQGMRKRGFIAHAAAFNNDFRQYSIDYFVVPGRVPIGRFFFFLKSIFRYDVFYFFWGVSLFDLWRIRGIDLPILKLFGKRVIVHFRGTDILNIAYYSYLAKTAQVDQSDPPLKMRPDQKRRLKLWRRYANEIFVSTPDLLELVPEAHLVPQVVDVNQIEASFSVVSSPKLVRVGHAPTRRSTKGTSFLINAVSNLRAKGLAVDLDLIEGVLPDQVIKRLSDCDIVVDQLLLGWYGKVSVEAMALGKPVVCNIDETLRGASSSLPIIHADQFNLESVLEDLITDGSKRYRSGLAGRQYVLRHHDVEVILDQIAKFL